MISRDQINKAVSLIVEAVSPRRIILFGSYARGEQKEYSDLDFLVLEKKVVNRHAEMVRLLRVLEPYEIPADVIVVSEEFYDNNKDTPGTVLFEAALEGKVVHESS